MGGFTTSNPKGTSGRRGWSQERLLTAQFLVRLGRGDISQKPLKKNYWNCTNCTELELRYSDLATEEVGTPQKALGLQTSGERAVVPCCILGSYSQALCEGNLYPSFSVEKWSQSQISRPAWVEKGSALGICRGPIKLQSASEWRLMAQRAKIHVV